MGGLRRPRGIELPKKQTSQVDAFALIAALKGDLSELTASLDQSKDAAYSLALMAGVFNEIETAMERGATRKQVMAVLAKRGLAVPVTRFDQNMAHLRGLFGKVNGRRDVSPELVVAAGGELVKLRDGLRPSRSS